jgi:hypothetical protein
MRRRAQRQTAGFLQNEGERLQVHATSVRMPAEAEISGEDEVTA